MRRKLLDISGKIDPITVAIYELFASVAESKNINFFVVGATARDLILHHGFGIEARRATKDIDLAVQVSNWDEFGELKKGLIEKGAFTETRSAQRLMYEKRIPVDIVPFGEINEKDRTISWPPKHDVIMNIIGFDEAFNNAISVRLNANTKLDIFVASPASLALLKLFAWKDRAPGNIKDAIDLIFIIRSYLDAGSHERLHDEHEDLLDDDFDYVTTGARLLGRDITRILSEESNTVLKKILEEQTNEADRYPLVEDMTRAGTSDQFEENLVLLRAIKQGVTDITGL